MLDRTNGAISVDRAALFLDLDGAIVPIAETPDAAQASPACRIVLRRALDHLRGRLAIVSGRTIMAVDEILGGTVRCVAGIHGLERRTWQGEIHMEPPAAGIAEAAQSLQAFARAKPGLLVENKRASVAVHFRQAPEAAEAVIEAVTRLATAGGLEVQHGKAVAELRTPGPDKGSALERFMREPPFEGARPIFLGDDLTDEAGFAAASRLGGIGVLVGDRRDTLAQARVSDTVAALGWIMRSLDAERFEPPGTAWAA